MIRDFFTLLHVQIIAAAPQTVAPAVDQYQTIQKNLAPVPRRGPEAGFYRIHYDFDGLCVN